VDAAGNLLIADNENQRVRVVAESTGEFYGVAMTAGDIYTVAGDGTEGFSGDGGPATSAELAQPFDVAVDSAGNLLFADAINGRIRMVTAERQACPGAWAWLLGQGRVTPSRTRPATESSSARAGRRHFA
jgi:hypothetical protein